MKTSTAVIAGLAAILVIAFAIFFIDIFFFKQKTAYEM